MNFTGANENNFLQCEYFVPWRKVISFYLIKLSLIAFWSLFCQNVVRIYSAFYIFYFQSEILN